MLFFLSPLRELLLYSLKSDLYCYIPLIPFVSAYLIWLKKEKLCGLLNRSPRPVLLALAAGAGVLIPSLICFATQKAKYSWAWPIT